MATVLAIAQEAIQTKGVKGPSSLFAGDDYGLQVLGLVHETARDLRKRGTWQDLILEHTFATVAAETQFTIKTELPYWHKFINDTFWNRSTGLKLRGPLSPQAWQRNVVLPAAPDDRCFTIRGGRFLMPSTVTAGQTIGFEYLDKRFALASNGDIRDEGFESNTDTFRLDDELLILGVRWRYLQSKGLEYGEEFRLYEDSIEERFGSDKPSEVLNLNGGCGGDELGPSINEGSWGN